MTSYMKIGDILYLQPLLLYQHLSQISIPPTDYRFPSPLKTYAAVIATPVYKQVENIKKVYMEKNGKIR
jgi:hypothetical protein